MLRKGLLSLSAVLVLGAAALPALAQQGKPPSPRGTAATQVLGKWAAEGQAAPRYTGGKWIEVDYGRPIKRGREDLYGKGADYGKKLSDDVPVWRVGANKTTTLHTDAALVIAGKKVAAGDYSLFVELKESGWTLIVSSQKGRDSYNADEKTGIWGAYNYDSKLDVVRAPMTMVKLPHSVDQLTIGFLDVTEKGGKLAIAWDRTAAMVDFKAE